jgi:hypothetical protein
LAIDDASIFALSETDMEACLLFIKAALERSDTDKNTKLNLLFLLREVIDKTSPSGSGSFAATVLCLSLDLSQTLLALDVDEHTSGRFGRSTISTTDDSENLKFQQEQTLECLFSTVFCQEQIAYLLYSENGYMHVSTICNFLCSVLSQNNPSSPLYWKTVLHLLQSETWAAYFGPSYLLALLAELMHPSAPAARAPSAVSLVSCGILLLLAESMEAGTLTLIEDQTWVNGECSCAPLRLYLSVSGLICVVLCCFVLSCLVLSCVVLCCAACFAGLITACAIEIQHLASRKDTLAVAATEAQLFTLLTTLADSPVGARGIALNSPVRTWLLDKLVKTGETAASASGIVTKLLFHEDMEIIETLVQKQLTKRILLSLRSDGMQDEGLAQNALYLLRVLADFLTIEALELPKDTIALLSDLIYTYSTNEYLVGVATSLKTDLLSAYAVGPEAQLEALLDSVPGIHAGADGWVQTPDESGNLYYYNCTDGASQWEVPEGYSLLLRTLNEIMDMTCGTLKNNLSNVALTEQHMIDFYQILVYQGSDAQMSTKVMQFLHAQATQSGPVARDLLKVLPDTHVDVVVASLHSQMETLQVPETEVAAGLLLVERAFQLIDSLLLLPGFRDKLSGEEYIHLLCEACRKFMAHPVVLSKALTALGRLTRKSPDLVLLAFKHELHLIMSEVAQHHTQQLPAEGDAARPAFLAFLAQADENSGSSCSLRNTLGECFVLFVGHCAVALCVVFIKKLNNNNTS